MDALNDRLTQKNSNASSIDCTNLSTNFSDYSRSNKIKRNKHNNSKIIANEDDFGDEFIENENLIKIKQNNRLVKNCNATVNGIVKNSIETQHNNTNDAQRIPRVKLNSLNLEIDDDSILSVSTPTPTIVTKKKQHFPDGGFGWVVVFASFFLSLIIDGIAFSFGLIFTELLYYFKESKTKTAWIGAFHLSVRFLLLEYLVGTYR